MKPVVKADLCIGCGTCEGIVPEVFKLVDGISIVQDLDDYSEYKEKIEQSITACPSQCISQ